MLEYLGLINGQKKPHCTAHSSGVSVEVTQQHTRDRLKLAIMKLVLLTKAQPTKFNDQPLLQYTENVKPEKL